MVLIFGEYLGTFFIGIFFLDPLSKMGIIFSRQSGVTKKLDDTIRENGRRERASEDFDRMWLHLLTCIRGVTPRDPLRTDDEKIPLSDMSCHSKLCNVIHGKFTMMMRRRRMIRYVALIIWQKSSHLPLLLSFSRVMKSSCSNWCQTIFEELANRYSIGTVRDHDGTF